MHLKMSPLPHLDLFMLSFQGFIAHYSNLPDETCGVIYKVMQVKFSPCGAIMGLETHQECRITQT